MSDLDYLSKPKRRPVGGLVKPLGLNRPANRRHFSIDMLEQRVLLSAMLYTVSDDGVDEYTTDGTPVHVPLISLPGSFDNTPDGFVVTGAQLIAVSGSDLFVVNSDNESTGKAIIGEYTTSGKTINSNFITDLDAPRVMRVYGSNLFIGNSGSDSNPAAGSISEYTTAGVAVNTELVGGLYGLQGLAISDDGSDLFVSTDAINTGNPSSDQVGIYEFTTGGVPVMTPLVGSFYAGSLAVMGDNLYAGTEDNDLLHADIDVYSASTGVPTQSPLISGLTPAGPGLGSLPGAMAIFGSDLFIEKAFSTASISEFTLAGAPVTGFTPPAGSITDFAIGGTVSTSNQLAFGSQPTGSLAPGALGTVTVDAEDPSGALLSSYNSDITLALTGGIAGATLGGTVTVAAINGVATFSDLSITTVGNDYVLNATDGSSTAATGNPFNISTTGGGGSTSLTPTVTKSTLPAAVVAAAKVKGNAAISIAVTNSGATTARGADTIALYATTTGVIDSASILIGSTKKTLTLPTGKAKTISVAAKNLSQLSPGAYTVLSQVTDAGGNKSAATSGPTVTVAAPFVSLSALVGTVPATPITPGKSIAITLTLTNAGNVDSTGLATLSPGLSTGESLLVVPVIPLHKSLSIKAGGKPLVVHLKIKIPASTPAGSYLPYVTFTQASTTLTADAASDVIIG